MNTLGMIVGEAVATLGNEILEKVMDKFSPSSNGPKFLDAYREKIEAKKITSEDLQLSRDEELALIEIKEYAHNRGLKNIQVEIRGKAYHLDTSDMSLVPMLSQK
jgi:hypothetical protein